MKLGTSLASFLASGVGGYRKYSCREKFGTLVCGIAVENRWAIGPNIGFPWHGPHYCLTKDACRSHFDLRVVLG